TTELNNEFLLNYNVVVLVGYDLSKQIEINNFTHKNGIHFISAATYGLVGQIFCDNGLNFIVYDQDGEQVRSALIESIENSVNPLVKVVDTKPHNLVSGNTVKFTNVRGMIEILDRE